MGALWLVGAICILVYTWFVGVQRTSTRTSNQETLEKKVDELIRVMKDCAEEENE
jgi:hypothetical protein